MSIAQPSAGWINWRFTRFPILASTNDLALEWLRAGLCPVGDVIVADEQTSGRGRPGRNWVSPKGSLLMTAILPLPPDRPERIGWAALLAGIAVARAVREFNVPAGVKWPNDVIIEDAKLAGILVETSVKDRVAVGIGLNVSNELATDLNRAVTRMVDHAPDVTVDAVLGRVLEMLEATWPLMDAPDAEPLRAAWEALDTTAGRKVRWSHGDLLATAEGISPDGALWLQLPDGSRVAASVGEVQFA